MNNYKNINKNGIKELKTCENNTRNYSLDLLRIISMMMVIILHFNQGSGFLKNTELEGSMTYTYIWSTEFLCIGAVNIFVLLSGYFMIKSQFKLKKVIKFEIQVLSYSVLIYIIAIIFNITVFNKDIAIYSILPLTTARYWFMTSFIGLYIISPFLNMLLLKLNKKQYQYLVAVLVCIFSLVVSIYRNNTYIGSGNGYNIAWFIVLYIIAGYIRLHFNKEVKKRTCIATIFFIVIIQMLIKTFLSNSSIELLQGIEQNSLAYSNILNVILALAFLMLFKNIEIKGKVITKLISKITPLLLGVFLFHTHFAIAGPIWQQWLKPFEYLYSYRFIIMEILDVLILFSIGCIIEHARKKILEVIPHIITESKLVNKIENKIQNMLVEN